jgi:hypothetical protein
LALKEADATDKLFVLMHCGPPFAFEHSAAKRPQPIELLLQLVVCPGRQRLVDNVYQSFVKLGHGEARLIPRQNSLHVSDQLAEPGLPIEMGEQRKFIDDDAVERAARSFGLRLDPFENVSRQPQVHPIGSPLF